MTQQENAFRQLEQENEDRRMAEQMANPGGGDGGGGGGGMMQPPQGMDGLAQDDFRPDTAAALQAVQAMESEGGFSPPSGAGDGGMGDSQLVSNQPYDEALMAATSEEESMMSNGLGGGHADTSMNAPGAAEQQAVEQERAAHPAPEDTDSEPGSPPGPDDGDDALADFREDALSHERAMHDEYGGGGGDDGGAAADSQPAMAAGQSAGAAAPEGDSDDDSSSSDEESGMGHTAGMGGDDDFDYSSLDVGPDVRDLFEHIGRYQPHSIELEAHLKPFVPDFIPGIGDADAFIKVGRPDGEENTAGLTILDEPLAVQSDAGVLELQLRAQAKMSNVKEASVRSVQDADKNPAALTKWMESVGEIQRTRPQPTVTYTHEVPTLDTLMQAWPPELEAALSSVELPTAMLDMELGQYCTTLCALLDIPVHEGKLVESMHQLFTLFSEFKANQHFAQYGGEEEIDKMAEVRSLAHTTPAWPALEMLPFPCACHDHMPTGGCCCCRLCRRLAVRSSRRTSSCARAHRAAALGRTARAGRTRMPRPPLDNRSATRSAEGGGQCRCCASNANLFTLPFLQTVYLRPSSCPSGPFFASSVAALQRRSHGRRRCFKLLPSPRRGPPCSSRGLPPRVPPCHPRGFFVSHALG